MKKIILALFLGFSALLHAQNKISGTITNKESSDRRSTRGPSCRALVHVVDHMHIIESDDRGMSMGHQRTTSDRSGPGNPWGTRFVRTHKRPWLHRLPRVVKTSDTGLRGGRKPSARITILTLARN